MFIKQTSKIALWGALVVSLFTVSCSKNASPVSKPAQTLGAGNGVGDANGVGSPLTGTYFDLSDTRDLVTPVDFTSAGTAHQVICYRPGTGTNWLMDESASTTPPAIGYVFTPYPISGSQTNGGIGPSGTNFNLTDNRDRIIPFDYTGDGKRDHIIVYRPGGRAFWIFKKSTTTGVWENVWMSSWGVGPNAGPQYDLSDSRDILVPFDALNSGHMSDLICYRPGTGLCWIMHMNILGDASTFYPLLESTSGVGAYGLSGYVFDLSNGNDRIIATGGTGIIAYRPGGLNFWSMYFNAGTPISNSTFSSVVKSTNGIVDPVSGSRYDLSDTRDQIITYNDGTATSNNCIVAYRPGGGVCYMFKFPSLSCFYHQNGGIGSTTAGVYYDLSNNSDKVIAYDADGTGKDDYLMCYRPGGKACWLMQFDGQHEFNKKY